MLPNQDLFYANQNGNIVNAPPCSTNDGKFFEFLPSEQVGITQGANTLASMGFSDIAIPVDSYTMQTKLIGPQEVIFIQGLSKGLTFKIQKFNDVSIYSDTDQFYLQLDLSINYFKNFKYVSTAICASGNYGQNINVTDALNIQLGNNNFYITTTNDASSYTFTSTKVGYEFDISNIVLTRYDASSNIVYSRALTEDPSAYVPSTIYPTSAMKGILIKALYPTSNPDPTQDWLYINHVVSPFTYFSQSTCDSSIVYLKETKLVDVGSAACSTNDTISAGDYLNYISENELWKKFSKMYLITEAIDSSNYMTENYIEGMYVYNPHSFAVQIEYIQFV